MLEMILLKVCALGQNYQRTWRVVQNKSKPDQQDGGDKHHPNLEVNIPH